MSVRSDEPILETMKAEHLANIVRQCRDARVAHAAARDKYRRLRLLVEAAEVEMREAETKEDTARSELLTLVFGDSYE